MVSPVRADGLPRTGAVARDGVASLQLVQRTNPVFSGRHRAGVDSLSWPQKLVDGGRWKPVVSCVIVGQNHHSNAREWNRHGGCFRALLLGDSWGGVGADGAFPAAHEVEAEQAFAGLV